jgi:hypothetical protein
MGFKYSYAERVDFSMSYLTVKLALTKRPLL